MSCVIEDSKRLRQELIKAHISKKGLDPEKAEQDFITFAQSLPHYGGHFYTATWVSISHESPSKFTVTFLFLLGSERQQS